MSPTDAIKHISWKWFLLLLLWGGIIGLTPVIPFVLDSWHDYPLDGINWKMVWHMAVPAFGLGCLGYWRKYKAFLQLPPGFEQLMAIRNSSTSVDTQGNVTRTVEQSTTITTPAPTPKPDSPQ